MHVITTAHIIMYNAAYNVAPYLAPDKLSISRVDFGSRELTFNWSLSTVPDCPALHYKILASNCGSCPTTTTRTTVTCTDIPTNGMCMFALQTVVCGYIIGNMSDRISITLANTTCTNKGLVYLNILYIVVTILSLKSQSYFQFSLLVLFYFC